MKQSKRLSALLLAICLIVSMIVPAVYAEETTTVTYDFKFQQICADNELSPAGSNLAAGNASTKIIPQLADLHEQGVINWEYKGVNVLKSAEFLSHTTYGGYFHTRSTVGNWVAFKIDNPGAGKWKLSVEHMLTKHGAKDVNIYILPGTTKDLEGAMKPENVTQVISCYDSAVSGERPKTGAYTYTNTEFEVVWETGTKKSNPSYILLFEMATANESSSLAVGQTNGELAADLYLSSLTATLIEAGEEEPEEEEDDDIILSDTFPIEGAIAHEDIVSSVNALFYAVDTIDGVDYLYLFFDGNKMSVYNLDTGELYDRESNSFGTPRSVWIDEQTHVVWVSGSSKFLYKYDPATKTGERIYIPDNLFPEAGSFNAWGINGDGQGNLYFATYNACYFGKYNINTGTFTQIGDILVADGIYSGNGGVVLKDGYAYINIDGDKNNDGVKIHQILKVDINTGAVVDSVDVSSRIGSGNVYLSHMKLVGDVILCSADSTMSGCVAVDISGEKMVLKDIPGMEAGFSGKISSEIDGKVYFMGSGNKGLLAYDVATGEVTETGIANSGSLKFSDCLVTVAGNDKLPGQSLVTMNSASLNRVDVVFYNLTTKETVTLTDYTEGLGSGNTLRSMTVSADGKTVYIGAYGNNQLAVYDVESAEVVKLIPTVNTQIEGMIWYDGYMYTGNYSSCSINKVDVKTGERTLLVNLRNSTFWQYRIHATAVGNGNVYFGTAPSTGRLGGVLTWYDVSEHRVYVAAGPNPEDVYWQDADTPDAQEWYCALTGAKAPFSRNDDANITDKDGNTVQRFTGVIKNQSIITMVYQDGYIIGSTSKHGGSGSVFVDDDNACIFVYDAKNWELVARYDLADAISGLTGLVEYVDVVAADPDVPGKFWGVVSDTLFSFTFDAEAGTISVKTEVSLGTTGFNHGNNTLQGRNIIFDGDFMYVVFGSYGTYMIKRDDVSVRYKVSDAIPKQMVLAGDGNIYYHDSTTDLKVLRIAQAAQLIKDPYEIENAKALINALDDAANITLEDEAAVLAARAAYDALSENGKAAVDES